MTSVMRVNTKSGIPAKKVKAEPTPEVLRKVGKAKSLLVLDHPFFGATVSKRPLKYASNVPTACMSARGQITINPEFAEKLTVQNLVFLLAHEACHYMFAHSLRRKHRQPRPWNVACDLVINDMLIDAGVGDFIEGGVTFDGARQQAAEALYQEPPKGGDGGGGDEGGGDDSSDQPNGGIGDDIEDPADEDGQPLDESEIHEIETQAKVDMLQAAKAAKAMGKLPANMERMIDEVMKVTTPWHKLTEEMMTSYVKDAYSWRNPNRRHIANNVYLPGADYVPKMGEVVIGVDTSGSIGQKELNEFNAHINRILEVCGPEKTTVVYCDARVAHVDEYDEGTEDVKLSPHGGGGTSFQPVFDYVEEHGISPECLIYLTDGYGDQSSITAPIYPVIWLTTAYEEFPWGNVVKFESTES